MDSIPQVSRQVPRSLQMEVVDRHRGRHPGIRRQFQQSIVLFVLVLALRVAVLASAAGVDQHQRELGTMPPSVELRQAGGGGGGGGMKSNASMITATNTTRNQQATDIRTDKSEEDEGTLRESNSPQRTPAKLDASQEAPPEPLPASSDDNSVISSSEILNNPVPDVNARKAKAAGELGGENPNSRRRADNVTAATTTTTTTKSDYNLDTSDSASPQTSSSMETEATGADKEPANSPAATDDQRQDHELESNSQRTSRLLLQLLVLGLFILVSSSLIIVYSIKFCVCQRRKERRLLRRALIGDLSASSANGGGPSDMVTSGVAAIANGRLFEGGAPSPYHHQLMALRGHSHQQQQHGQGLCHLQDGFLFSPAECACLQSQLASELDSLDETSETEPDASGQPLQMLDCFAAPPICHLGVISSPLHQQQPQLVLLLLNRLQQLLTPTSSVQATNINANHQLGQLIGAQLQAQLAASPPQVPSHNVAGLRLAAAAAAATTSGACICSHQQPLLLAQPLPANARPPAYSELYLATSSCPSAPSSSERQQTESSQARQSSSSSAVVRQQPQGRIEEATSEDDQ